MPYIKPSERNKFDVVIRQLPPIALKGELEYVVFSIMKQHMYDGSIRYAELHDIVYAVQHCADEFRRRYLDVREDKAREANGDV